MAEEQVSDEDLLLTIPTESGVPVSIISYNFELVMTIDVPQGTGGGETSSIFFF